MKAGRQQVRAAAGLGIVLALGLSGCGALEEAAQATPDATPAQAAAPNAEVDEAAEGLGAAGSPSCVGLVPRTAGTPRQVHYQYTAGPEQTVCTTEATADGRGTVALQAQNLYEAPGGVDYTWYLLDASGAEVGQLSGGKFSRGLLPQAAGFQLGNALDFNAGSGFFLDTYDGAGAALARTEFSAQNAMSWASALDEAGGGSVIVYGTCDSLFCDTGGWHLFAQRFDASGTPRGAPAPVASGASGAPPGAGTDEDPSLQVAVDLLGRTLVLWDGPSSGYAPGSLAGRWLDRSGAPLTPVFQATSGLSPTFPAHLRPLLGGGLVLQLGGRWVRAFPSGQRSGTAAPGWLAGRPNAQLELLPGQRGYALLPPAGESLSRCVQQVEIRNASGGLCGQVRYPLAEGACVTEPLHLGRDGTVIQRFPSSDPHQCTYQWWPASLR